MDHETDDLEEVESPTGEAEDPAQQDDEGAEDQERSPGSDEEQAAADGAADQKEPVKDHEPPQDSPRWKEIYGRMKQAEREAEFWRQQATGGAAVPGMSAQRATDPKQEIPPEQPRPKEADFEDYSEFVRAENDWTRNQTKRELLQQQAEKQREMSWVSFVDSVVQKSAPAREKHADWHQVVQQSSAPLSPAIIRAANRLEHTGEVLYELASNPGKCLQIAQMPPEEIGIELFKINQKFAAPAPTPPRTRTQAPEPIRPVGNVERAAAHVDESKMTDEEHFAFLERRRAAARQSRMRGR